MAHDTKPKEQAEAAELQPTFGRYAEIPYDQMTSEQQEGYHELLRSIGGEPGTQMPGPLKIWVNNPKLATAMGPITQHFSPPNDSLSEREHELAVSIINSKWHTPYSINAHVELAEKLGLPANMVEAAVCGLPASFSDEREQLIYEIVTALANSRWVPKSLYDRAVKALGHVGITDVTVLMGYYTAVSLTLAFYDVPAGATGMNMGDV